MCLRPLSRERVRHPLRGGRGQRVAAAAPISLESDDPSPQVGLRATDRPSAPCPEAVTSSQPRGRAAPGRPAAWSRCSGCAPLLGARWETRRHGDVASARCSVRPRCATGRSRQGDRADGPAGDGWSAVDLLSQVHPVHVPFPRWDRASGGQDGAPPLTICPLTMAPLRRSVKPPDDTFSPGLPIGATGSVRLAVVGRFAAPGPT